MNYAATTAKNAGILSQQQPQPDPALLETGTTGQATYRPEEGNKKLNIVPADYKKDTSYSDATQTTPATRGQVERKGDQMSKEAKRKVDEMGAETKDGVERLKKKAARLERQGKGKFYNPEVQLTLLGVVNIAIVGIIGSVAFSRRHERWDRRIVSAIALGVASLWAGQSYFALDAADRKSKRRD